MSSFITPNDRPPVSTLDRHLATHISMRREIEADLLRRDWYNVLQHNVKVWEGRRVSKPSESPSNACWNFVRATGGTYFEGLVMLPEHKVPQAAVWCWESSTVTCFSHDLTGVHAIQGIPLETSEVRKLRRSGVQGPYLFHPDRRVYDLAIAWIQLPTIRGNSLQ